MMREDVLARDNLKLVCKNIYPYCSKYMQNVCRFIFFSDKTVYLLCRELSIFDFIDIYFDSYYLCSTELINLILINPS